MYSREDRSRAIELLISNKLCYADTVRELGYPDYSSLRQWYKDYLEEKKSGVSRPENPYVKYTYEQKKAAVEYYKNHERSISCTIRAMGYPSRPLLTQWITEIAPESRKERRKAVKHSEEAKRAAVAELCERKSTAAQIAAKYQVDRASLYTWKRQLENE